MQSENNWPKLKFSTVFICTRSEMITKYFASVKVKFDPFTASARPARLFLARIPSTTKIQCTILSQEDNDVPKIEVTFKDKYVMDACPASMNTVELASLFDSHSRKLALQDAIKD